MSINSASIEDFIGQQFDYLIIGGGTAGLAVAARLSENTDLMIGVLEAGPAVKNVENVDIPGLYGQSVGTSLDWQFETVPQPGLDCRILPWPRGKLLGGTSALNFMTWNRASRQDYDAWAHLGNHGWGWDDLLPFFKKSETFHKPEEQIRAKNKEFYDETCLGATGPIQVSYSKGYSSSHQLWHDTLNKLGVKTNEHHMAGSNVGVWTNINSVNPSTYERSYSSTAYYLPHMDRRNLVVLCDALVGEVILDAEEETDWTAHGVNFTHGGKNYSVSASREIILSAGSVQSPQLLELSGIGNSDILRRAGVKPKVDNLNVGENLQDHIMTAMIFEVEPQLANPGDLIHDNVAKNAALNEFKISRTGPLTVLPCSICYVPLALFAPPDVLLSIASKVDDLTGMPTGAHGVLKQRFGTHQELGHIEYIFDLGNWNPYFEPSSGSGKKYGTMLQILQYPFSRGSIHIQPVSNSSTKGVNRSNAAIKPRIDPRYYEGPGGDLDLEIMLHCARFADQICKTSPLAGIIRARASPPPSATEDEDLRNWIVKNTITDYHPVGTCAMGGLRGRETGVVDDRLRVYGVKRLRVIDASIMPLQISAHLQATVYAIAEKGASMILEDRLQPRLPNDP